MLTSHWLFQSALLQSLSQLVLCVLHFVISTVSESDMAVPGQPLAGLSGGDDLLEAFCTIYHCSAAVIHEAINSAADSVILSHLSDDLDKYARLVEEV